MNEFVVPATAVVAVAGLSMIPGVGETMDGYDLVDPESSGLDRSMAGGSLALSAYTAGLTPNIGPIKRAVMRGAKSINLPSARTIKIDMGHISSGHMKGGSRVSPKKDLFPESWSAADTEKAVREAYSNAKRVETQGTRVRVQGTTSGGKRIEMWVNTETKTIETAYPIN